MLSPTEQIVYGGVRIMDRPCLPNVRRLDHGALQMVLEFHRHGIQLDTDHMARLSTILETRSAELSEQITKLVGHPVNHNSGDQIAHLLFHELELIPQRATRLTPSGTREVVDDEVLAGMMGLHPVVGLIREARQMDKYQGTYTDKLPLLVRPETGRLHTWFKHTRTATGRLASEDPNLQNIPTRTKLGAEIRNGFTAGKLPDGTQCQLVSFDLSQIEMVLAAHLSQDPTFIAAFLSGWDIHTITACNCFQMDRELWLTRAMQAAYEEELGDSEIWETPEQKAEWKEFKQTKRLPAKVCGFGIVYGQTSAGLQSNIVAQGGPFLELSLIDIIISEFFGGYDGLAVWMDMQHARAVRHGMVWDMFGRVRLIPEAQSTIKRIRNAGLRQAGNMPIQGSAQGLIKLAMWQLMEVVRLFQSYPGSRCWPLLQIHDELIFECSPDILDEFRPMVLDVMKHNVELSVPINASCGVAERWGELK